MRTQNKHWRGEAAPGFVQRGRHLVNTSRQHVTRTTHLAAHPYSAVRTAANTLQTLQSTQMSSTGILKVLEVKLLSADWGVVEGLRWVGVAREEAGLGVKCGGVAAVWGGRG